MFERELHSMLREIFISRDTDMRELKVQKGQTRPTVSHVNLSTFQVEFQEFCTELNY